MHSAQEGVGVRGTSVCRSWCAGLSVHTPDASIPHLKAPAYVQTRFFSHFILMRNGTFKWIQVIVVFGSYNYLK